MHFPFLFVFFACCSAAWSQTVPEHKMQQMRREARDPSIRDKVEDFQFAAEYWCSSKNLKNIPDIDAALAAVMPFALEQSPEVKDFQSWEKAHEYKSYHDAGAVLLAKCYTLLYYGRVKEAREGLELIRTKLRYSMLLRRNREVLWVRKQMHYHEHFCALYARLVRKEFDAFRFPPERDEFDGEAMHKALTDMIRLRIQDGGVSMLEHLCEGMAKSALALPTGQRGTYIALGAVLPQPWESDHEASWHEMRDGIARWRREAPASVFARLAEARFQIEYAKHALGRSDNPPSDGYAAYQQRISVARDMLASCPRDNAEWYVSQLELQRCLGTPFSEVAVTFQEGMKHYPGYVHIQLALCRYLNRNQEVGAALTAATLKEISKGPNPENAAYCLRWLVLHGETEHLVPRLDLTMVSEVLRSGIKTMPFSLQLRSDYGFVALKLAQQETARWCLQGMKYCWDRDTWKDREDIVLNLASDGPLAGIPEPRRTSSL
ncbi:MAG: hypothetical protein JNG86_12790 [Verrucomicrobiaceae bacterium]|nr:hypothetical protein [Verrucomicrobiaceae bacterium]